ncbi:hypothetical protein [Nannocystis pusilla]|uniref:hypothetical protein n=1 Tax=Nannocystis pusilla TaxID=889268 RepID=UPI003B7B43F2
MRKPEDLDRLAAQRVRVTGVYQAMTISQRGDAKAELAEPGAAGIRTDSGQVVLLGVYHRADGVRASDERQRHDGKRVEVIGVLERRTPAELAPDGQPGATMINPYVHSIESIRQVDARQ